MTSPSYLWEKQKHTDKLEVFDCPEFNPYDGFKRDPSGFYLLVKVDFATYRIEVAICNKDHVIEIIFSGRKSQDVYESILAYEKKNKRIWFKDKTHIAYLGKELKKAEIALALGHNSYFQE